MIYRNQLPPSVSCQTMPSRVTAVPGSQGPRHSGSVMVDALHVPTQASVVTPSLAPPVGSGGACTPLLRPAAAGATDAVTATTVIPLPRFPQTVPLGSGTWKKKQEFISFSNLIVKKTEKLNKFA